MKPTPIHIIIKTTNVKDKKKILKRREKQLLINKKHPKRLSVDFSA